MQKKTDMQFVSYLFFRATIFLFWLMPFWMLYLLSDGLRFLFLYVLKYRYKVVKQNLEKSFPEKSTAEIRSLIKDSYKNLCDILLEGIKGMSFTDKQVMRRYKFINPEIVDQYAERGQHAVAFASHYSNWEWGVHAISVQLKHMCVAPVAKVKNKYIDDYIQRHRNNDNMRVIHAGKSRAIIDNWEGRPALFIYVSDQSPPNPVKAQWIEFLNQDTACLWGADRLARRKNYPTFNIDIQRVGRGRYEVTFEVITENSIDTQDGEITEKYMRLLEKTIIEKPGDWLWSHRRWKHKKPVEIN